MGTQFIQIPRRFLELTSNTKFIDVLVYATIDNQIDSDIGTSKIAYKTISDKWKIPYNDVKRSIKRLKENGYIDYTKKQSNNNEYLYNEYTLPYRNENFLMLDPSLLEQELKPKDKGFLIYLQLLAEINLNEIYETRITKIAELLHTDRKTVSKYLKYFLSINQLSISRCGFYTCKYLFKKNKSKPKFNLIL